MPKRPKTVSVTLGDRLHDAPRQATSMSLPVPVHHRLDVIAERLQTVGATRADIVGMLLTEVDVDDDERLVQQWVEYKRMRVRDALPPRPAERAAGDDNVVELPRRSPGRPRKSAG